MFLPPLAGWRACAALALVALCPTLGAAQHTAPGAASEAAPPPAESATELGPPQPSLAARWLAARAQPHGADAPLREPRGGATWDTWGLARVRAAALVDLHVDDAGHVVEGGLGVASRLVAGASWFPTSRINLWLELEALNGQVVGPQTSVGTDVVDPIFNVARDQRWGVGVFTPRRVSLSVLTDVGLLQVGHQGFWWGTGMLVHDGLRDPDFGVARRGNLSERILFATSPWQRSQTPSAWLRELQLLVAADLVYRDDNASLIEGDVAWGGVFGVRSVTPSLGTGLFVSYRHQIDRDDPRDPRKGRTGVDAVTTDVWVSATLAELAAQRLVVEGEAAFTAGHTDRPWLDETFEDGARIAAFGVFGRLRYDHDRAGLTARIDAGMASGDNDPRDRVARGFAFHSDMNVGLVLFDEVLPLVTARSAERVNDPGLIAVTPPGLRYTVNQGTVSNAVFINPVVRYRPSDWVELRAGYLAARTSGDLIDVYQAALRGGYNTTPGGASPGSRVLGHEFDLGLRSTIRLPGAVALVLGAEGGVLLPGAALDGLGLGTPWSASGLLDVQW